MLSIHELSADRVSACASQLCSHDLAELGAAGISDAHQMLLEALPQCLWAQEARWKDETIAVFGVRAMFGADVVGIPWMLTMTAMDDAQEIAVARAALRAVRRMRNDFDVLTNMVHRHNERAIRFIEWLGFHVEQEFCGPGYEFRLFHWRREPCAIL